MFDAILQDKLDFVELFADCGVDWVKFLDDKRLGNLYNSVSIIPNSSMLNACFPERSYS